MQIVDPKRSVSQLYPDSHEASTQTMSKVAKNLTRYVRVNRSLVRRHLPRWIHAEPRDGLLRRLNPNSCPSNDATRNNAGEMNPNGIVPNDPSGIFPSLVPSHVLKLTRCSCPVALTRYAGLKQAVMRASKRSGGRFMWCDYCSIEFPLAISSAPQPYRPLGMSPNLHSWHRKRSGLLDLMP
jgi:hypothetical protein